MPLLSADQIIELLGLVPHPEGGHFAEVFRAPLQVESPAHPSERAASTAIYFLLKAGELSALHRVRSDELWHHYAGDTLELHELDATAHTLHRLGKDLARGERPLVVIPAGRWQAARASSDAQARHGFVLCGCTVAPGFDFADFELPSRERMLLELPLHGDWVQSLTRS